MEITCTDGHVTIAEGGEEEERKRNEFDADHPGQVLREILKDYKSPVMEGMPPFTGGLVGYFSYEYIKYAEPSLKGVLEPEKCRDGQDAGSGREFRDMDLMLFDKVIVFDNYRQKLILITGVSLEGDLKENYGNALKELDDMERLIKSGAKADFRPLELEEPKPEADQETYCQMVEKAKEYIRDGDIFQVVLSNPMTAKAKGSLFDTYRVLRTTNPSPYMFYFSSDDIEVAGASPETLARLENGRLYTFPLAGTRPRGKTEEEDRRLEKELLRDEKELAEHNMLVDLGRNDIGKISRPGTVHVEKYMEIQRFSHVMHIGSTVSGEIRPDKDGVDVMSLTRSCRRALSPGLRRSVPARSLRSWNRAREGFTAGLSDIWILREISTPVFRSGWLIRKTDVSVYSPEPGSWRTVFRRMNLMSAGIRPAQ